MRTTRNLPDVFRVPNLQVFSEIVRDGMAKELDAYFTDPSGYPNLARIPKVQLAFASVGDHVYAVPVSYDRDLSNPSAEIAGWLLMQKDLPGKLGMSTPDTLDDLVAALKEVKSRGLTGFNDQPMFPLGFGRPQRLVAFGDRVYGSDGSDNPSLLGMSMHLDDAGRVVPGWATQERYEGLKLANMLWREGLIDPETFTQKSDVLHPKIANGALRVLLWQLRRCLGVHRPAAGGHVEDARRDRRVVRGSRPGCDPSDQRRGRGLDVDCGP